MSATGGIGGVHPGRDPDVSADLFELARTPGLLVCSGPKSIVDPSATVEKLEELRNHVAHKIGPIAKPANIVFTPELPKTRSGKIMRRLLRDVAENRPLGDTTTLADPTVVEEIRDRSVAEAPDE